MARALGVATARAMSSWWTPMLAGACASLGADSVMHPLDVLRVRVQAKATATNAVTEAAKLVRNEGVFGRHYEGRRGG